MRLMRALKRMRFSPFLLPAVLAVVLIGANEARAAITYQSAGAVAYSAGGGATVAPAYPASIAAGDLLVLIVGMKPSTANSGSVTTPAGWIPIVSLTGAGGYGGTLAGDTGNTNVFTFYKVAVGGEAGTLAVSLTTNNVSWAQMYRLSNATMGWSVAGTTGSDATGGAAVSIAMSADPGVTAGDYILGGMVIPTDVSTPGQFSGEALSQAGITFGTVVEIFSEPDSGNGNDIGGFTIRAPVSSGTSSAAPTLTATAGGTTTNVRGPGVFLRVREVAYTSGPGRYAVASGNWDATTTWSASCSGAAGASIPVAGADVTICSKVPAVTVTLNTNTAALNSLTIEATGTLRFGNNNTARTLTVAGSIANSGTLNVNTASNTTHSLVAGGDITNNGTFNLATDSGSLCNTTFNRNGGQTVSGAGATTRFNRITLNMGTSNANVLDITATNFSINPSAPTNFLSLINGTFKFSTTGTITPFTVAPTISGTRGFWVNNAGATVNSGNFGWTVSGSSDAARGLLRVSNGTLNISTGGVNDLTAGNFSEINFGGGTINIGGALTRSGGTDNILFTMSGGTLTVATAGQPGNYPFRLGTGASFTMSAGTIVVRQEDGNSRGYQNLASTANVTGGTLQIGDGSTPGGQVMEIDTTVPVGNLLVNSANATAVLTTALAVNSNVTIAAGTLDANDLNITLGGNWSRIGTFTPGTGTVTFNGGAAQGITGATTFNNVVIANATGVTANNNLTMNGNFTINASAVFNAGSVTHDLNGNFTNNGTFNPDTSTVLFSGNAVQSLNGNATTFYNLSMNNTSTGLTVSNNNVTVSSLLTFTDGNIDVATGGFTLITTSDCTAPSVSRPGTGHVIGNLRKRIPTGSPSCTFEIGDSANYVPVNLSFASVSVAGNVTASTTGSQHSAIASSGIDSGQSVNRYWTLAQDGSLVFTTYDAIFNFVAGDILGGADTNIFEIRRYSPPLPAAGSWSVVDPGTRAATSTEGTSITAFGDFVVGEPSISDTLREKEFIYQREIYY